MKFIWTVLLLLLANMVCFGQSTNAFVACQISYSLNGTDWVATNIYTEPITNGQTRFFRATSLVVPLIDNQTDISSVVYSGTNVTNINTEVYIGYFIVDSDNIQVRSQMNIFEPEPDDESGDCSEFEIEVIPSGSILVPDTVIFHCLDGVPCFDFCVG